MVRLTKATTHQLQNAVQLGTMPAPNSFVSYLRRGRRGVRAK